MIGKVLYLCHPEQDYGEYYLFSGLCQILGDENVVTYPFKKTYYGEIADDYILDDGKVGYTAPADYIVAREKNEWSFGEILNRMDDFSFIVLSSARTYAVHALRDFRSYLGDDMPALIFTEHEDGDNIRWDIINEFKPKVVFKRELLRETTKEGIYALPFSSPVNSYPQVDDSVKKHDVFALFGMTWPLRREVIEKILEWNLPNCYLGVDTKIRGDLQENNKKHVNYADYLTNIAHAKIAINVRGHGRDTVRRWEIPGYKTLMLICDPGLVVPNDFEDGVHAVYFKEDLSDLREKIDYFLSHDDEREKIAEAGHIHLMKYHTNKARADYFLKIVCNKLGIEYGKESV